MFFTRIAPEPGLEQIIECYWIAEDDDPTPKREKIIPDGFTELIFHYGDPYKINIHGAWETQPMNLLAGQISSHFFLENTGVSGIAGVKLKPAALSHLFDLDMSRYTDKVIALETALGNGLSFIAQDLGARSHNEKADLLNHYFRELLRNRQLTTKPVDNAVDLIFGTHGMVTVASVCDTVGVGERQLENLFRKHVGLSPKFFMRIVRFSYIFQLVQENNRSWSDLAYEAAYYDQSHFIRNFRDFTGENPADYAFDEKSMANFFLRKNGI